MSWFRYHIDAIDNPKVQSLPSVLFKFWVNLLCVAKISDGFLPEMSEISFRCRTSEVQAREWISELKRRRLIDEHQPNELFMHDWNGHQFASDSSTERTRKHRAKRSGNVPVTPPEQNRTDNRAEQNRTEAAAPPIVRAPSRSPIATDLNGQTSPRFEEWWEVWHSVKGTNHRGAAGQAWISVVSLTLESACFECTRSYLAALPDPAKGYNPENFLFEQAKDKFTARWPARAAPSQARNLTVLEQMQQEARNAKRKA